MSAQLNRLNRRMAAIPKGVREAVEPSLQTSANELVGRMQALAPADDGTLKASIRQEPGRHELSVAVTAGGPTTTRPVREGASATYDYALGVEFGTADTQAQSYFYPAWRLSKKRLTSRIKRAISKAVRTQWGS